jgi:multiple sugar transport system permease protein
LTYVPFGRYMLDTLFIAVMIIAGHLLSCTAVAYAFARLRAPGKNALWRLVNLSTASNGRAKMGSDDPPAG